MAKDKKCPDCAELVKADAKVCRFCGYRFASAKAGSSPQARGATADTATSGGGLKRVVGILVAVGIVAILIVNNSDGDREEAAETVAEETSATGAATAEVEEPTATTEVSCRDNLQCWADEHLPEADVYCSTRIERLGRYDHEWTDGWLELKFSRFQWADREAGSVRYWGDKIRFQNGFGAMQKYTYTCVYDPDSETVLAVDASPAA